MNAQEIRDLATEAAKAVASEWQIGSVSRFCDEPPEFEAADVQEIADFLLPFFERTQGDFVLATEAKVEQ